MFIPYTLNGTDMVRMRFRSVTADFKLDTGEVQNIEGKPDEVPIAIKIFNSKYGQA